MLKKLSALSAWMLAMLILCHSVAAQSDKPKKLPKQIQQLIAMTPEQFEQTATLKDDDLETAAVITTINGWQQKDGLLRLVNNDNFFRAFIHKKTGKTTFQVYHAVRYMQSGWAFFEIVNYETPDGPKSATLTVLGRDVASCSTYLGCTYFEQVAFEIDEALLRDVAKRYQPGQVAAWRYRLKAKSGAERDEGFVAAEVAGLLRAVDKYRAAKGLPSPQD